MENLTLVTDRYVFFMKGPLGNWFKSTIYYRYNKNEPLEKFFSSEHLFMYLKARYFKDDLTAKMILKCKTSEEAKNLGRMVKGFNEEEWINVRKSIMKTTILEKYKQCKEFRCEVDNSKYDGKTFVEANPNDTIWSCGLSMKDEKIKNGRNWVGLNLLGEIITEIREEYKTSIKLYHEQVVKINIKKNEEIPYMYGDFLALLHYDNILGKYVLCYPFDLNKNTVVSSESNFEYEDVIKINLTTFDEYIKWRDEHNKFKLDLFKEKNINDNSIEMLNVMRMREEFIKNNPELYK